MMLQPPELHRHRLIKIIKLASFGLVFFAIIVLVFSAIIIEIQERRKIEANSILNIWKSTHHPELDEAKREERSYIESSTGDLKHLRLLDANSSELADLLSLAGIAYDSVDRKDPQAYITGKLLERIKERVRSRNDYGQPVRSVRP